jgi:hypothetical protein
MFLFLNMDVSFSGAKIQKNTIMYKGTIFAQMSHRPRLDVSFIIQVDFRFTCSHLFFDRPFSKCKWQ